LSIHEISSAKEKKPSRFYYGYIIVLACFFIFLILGGVTFSFGVFFKPMLSEFGWTRAATSGAFSLNMILGGVFGILGGRLSDRFGPRIVLTFGGLLISLGYLLMSQVGAIWQIYLFLGVLPGIGMGGMAIPMMSSVARWFLKGRGLATGIVSAGVGVGIIIVPPLANLLISSISWRTSYLILGIVVLAFIIIPAQFIRRVPDQKIPLTQDTNAVKTDGPSLQVRGFSLREAICTRQFWIICIMSLFLLFCVQTVMVHIVAHATDLNISAATAATILSVIGIVNIGGDVVMGSLGDRIGSRNAMIIIFTLMSLSCLGAIFAGELWMLYLVAVVFGLSYGGFVAMQSPMVVDFFGLKALGAIFGLVMFATNIGGSSGPLVAGRIFDVSGSYTWAFILCTFLGLAGLTLSILLKTARK
jgi:MFS family permease